MLVSVLFVERCLIILCRVWSVVSVSCATAHLCILAVGVGDDLSVLLTIPTILTTNPHNHNPHHPSQPTNFPCIRTNEEEFAIIKCARPVGLDECHRMSLLHSGIWTSCHYAHLGRIFSWLARIYYSLPRGDLLRCIKW